MQPLNESGQTWRSYGKGRWLGIANQNLKNWANPIRERFRDGIIPARAAKPRVHGIENSQQVTKGTSQFPKNGLAGVMKYKIPHERRSREWGIYILSQLLSHEWGIGKYLEWRVGNLPSLYLSLMGFTLP